MMLWKRGATAYLLPLTSFFTASLRAMPPTCKLSNKDTPTVVALPDIFAHDQRIGRIARRAFAAIDYSLEVSDEFKLSLR
jgi:hypothetical protein